MKRQQFAIEGGTAFVYRIMLITDNAASDFGKKHKSNKSPDQTLIATVRQILASCAYANLLGKSGKLF